MSKPTQTFWDLLFELAVLIVAVTLIGVFVFLNANQDLIMTEQPALAMEPSTVPLEDLLICLEANTALHNEHYNPMTYTPVWITVYGLTVAECDADPTTGAFGKMGKYDREMALTYAVRDRFDAKPGDQFLILVPGDHKLSGIYHYYDHKPTGKGKNAFSIDLQVDNSNFSGYGFIVPYK